MVLDAVSNFVRGATDAAVDNSQTAVSVADASIFPDPSSDGEYNVVIWDANNFPRPDQDSDVEILRVTAVDTGADELTVTRAQEMTTAAAHPSGAAVHLSPTAKMFSDIESEYTAQGGNFDGEGTSEFSNLASLHTEDLATTDRDPDIVIKKDGSGTIKAIGDHTQGEIASGSSLSSVFNTARDNLTSGRDWKEKILIKGSFTVSSPLEPGDYIIVELQGRIKLADGADVPIIQNADRSDFNRNQEYVGGIYDGNKSNNTSGSGGVNVIDLLDVRECHYDRVKVVNSPEDAFEPNGGSDHTFSQCIAKQSGAEGFNPISIDRVIIDNCLTAENAQAGFHPSNNSTRVTVSNCISISDLRGFDCYSNENTIIDECQSYNPTEDNVTVSNGAGVLRISGIFRGGQRGIYILGENGTHEDIEIDATVKGASEFGLWLINAPGAVIRGRYVETGYSNIDIRDSPGVRADSVTAKNESTSFVNSSQANIKVWPSSEGASPNVRIRDPEIGDGQNVADYLIELEADDAELSGLDVAAADINAPGARPKFDGILYGGPLGGADIGSLTGASEGDRARSDGTNASASADELFILKSNGDWQSIADPSTTITPA